MLETIPRGPWGALTLTWSSGSIREGQTPSPKCKLQGMRLPALLLCCLPLSAQEVPTPEDSLGWPVGRWHVRHDSLVRYFEQVAAASPKVTLQEYARTYEGRPLLLAAVTSEANQGRLEEIRTARRAWLRDGGEEYTGPDVVWMGYGVHGNEPSGTNASLRVLHHLATSDSEAVRKLLDDTVVLIDPCLNPDGTDRFAHWANSHRGKHPVAGGLHRERREAWPGGRTNYYWFDLNRDWLLLTHPESRGRVQEFHRWLPSIVTDYHEMGTDSSYFFQPGIPSRRNPITPEENVTLTQRIAEYHAKALDARGSLYYTEESFDDFYYGKGSTYPDVHGAIGILFEQASSRGHLEENANGELSFPFTIENQFTTSLSTLKAAHKLRGDLMAYGRTFWSSAFELAEKHVVRAYVFGAAESPKRTALLAELLMRHGIEVHALAEPFGEFTPETSFIVPMSQAQFRLCRAVFETRTSWPDNTFYDVSSWTLPLSFDVPYHGLSIEEFDRDQVGERLGDSPSPAASFRANRKAVAYAFEWRHHEAPRVLAGLLGDGVRARFATRTLTADTTAGQAPLDLGTIVIPMSIQDVERAQVEKALASAAKSGVEVHALTGGLTPAGIDLGSPSLSPLEPVVPALVVGSGVSGYEAGSVWFHLDQRLDLPTLLIERNDLGRLDLHGVSHLLLTSGAQDDWSESTLERVRHWIRDGGTLVASKSAASWAVRTFFESEEREEAQDEHQDEHAGPEASSYADYSSLRARQRVSGTIFEAKLDRTHPLAYGFGRDRLPVFKNSTSVLPEAHDPFSVPVRYTDDPLWSGFASERNVARIAGTPAVRVERVGNGTVVALLDDPLFRGVWHGTSRLYANALFFAPALRRTGSVEEAWSAEEEAEQADAHDH